MVEDEFEEARVGFFQMDVEREVRLVEQLVEFIISETQLQVPDVQVVMNLIGVAHQEDFVVLPNLFEGFDALTWDVEEHGVPDRVEFLVGHFFLPDEFLHLFPEGGSRVNAGVEFAHNLDKILGMSEFRNVDSHFFEFLVNRIFVDVQNDTAEVEDDIFDFCVHF